LAPSFVGWLDNHEAFPEFCAKSSKWFRGMENCFVVRSSDEIIAEDNNEFSRLQAWFKGRTGLDQWLISAKTPDMTGPARAAKRLFYVSLVDNYGRDSPLCELRLRGRRLTLNPEKLRERLRVVPFPPQRMAVMRSGDIIAGSNPSTRKPKVKPEPVIVKSLDKGAKPPARRADATAGDGERRCGAMSQQRTDSGATSTPQKFLHLVGCHDPKARPPGGR
jgi:hypothetical protein